MALETIQGRILFIDAYDSFSENIAALLCQVLGVQVTMIHIDTPIEDLLKNLGSCTQQPFAHFLQQFSAVVLGPGPGNPETTSDIGLFSEIWKLSAQDTVPVLGICLGFQSLCIAYGGYIRRLLRPCHGHAKKINHCGEDIFADVGEVVATNYNSLEVKLGGSDPFAAANGTILTSSSSDSRNSSETASCPNFKTGRPEFSPSPNTSTLRPLAWDGLGTLMSVKHVDLPYWGLQFHPESCKSNIACQKIIRNWWEAGMHWSICTKSVTSMPRSLLPCGHIWSRPLTPINIMTAPRNLAENQSHGLTLCEEMQALTSSCAKAMECHTSKLSVSVNEVEAFCRFMFQNEEVMLESTQKGRYSIYAMPSPVGWRLEYSLKTSICTIYRTDQHEKRWTMKLPHVLDQIHGLVASRGVGSGQKSLPFWGGFIGFLSYEVGLYRLDVSLARRRLTEGLPDISLQWVERSIVIDHFSGEVHVQSLRRDDSTWIRAMVAELSLREGPRPTSAPRSKTLQELLSSAEITLPDEETYKHRIQACQSYLHSGDSYELCLTTEAQVSLPSGTENSWLLYRNLRRHNPVPFSALLRLGKTTILSSSPEHFLSWDRSTGAIDMIPMKGTVAKSPSMTPEHAKEILASPKETAENLMIADLIRHDLYSAVGWNASVSVVKLCEVVEHETVYQLVSHIRALPPIPLSPPDDERQQEIMRFGHKALQQTLPPGSMTGAPKKRSCEILERLEERRRGVYSGVLGYLDVGGGGAFSVCIRTAVSTEDEDRDGRQIWRIGAGGAITVLSDVDAEWSEMNTKLESVLRAFKPDA